MDVTLSPEDDFPGMLLHQAALWDNCELLEDLLRGEQKAHINSQDSWGRTPLHAAAITNKSRCLAVLLEAGANPNIPCGPRGEYRTALHTSAKFGFVSNVKTLLNYGAALTVKDKLGLTPLDIAERSEHLECVSVLQQAANERENNRLQSHATLREACLARDMNLAKELLEKLGEDAESIVNRAPNGANTLLFLCCEAGDKDLVGLLLDYGADGRVHPVTKYSPLYIACYNGHDEIAEMILNKFPDLILQWTVEKWLPIHATCIGGHVAVLELLLNFNYPQHLLMKFSDSSNQWEYEMAFDINLKDASGQTPLYLTCLLGNTKMCETLLKFKVKAVKKNSSQEVTPTSESSEPVISPAGKRRISGGIQNIMSRLNLKVRPEGVVKKETEKFVSPVLLDIQCSELRETALHVSVRNKCSEIASLLVAAGANPNLYIQRISSHGEDDIGVNCLVEAAKNRDVAMVDMLLRHGARDDFSKALSVTVQNQDDILTAKLLSTKAHPDPEYKLNKKAMTEQLPRGSLITVATLTYSSVFPNTPVMINWHGNRCLLSNIKANWLVDAALNVNPKLKLNPRNQEVVLFAITRLDLSNNALTCVPAVVFQLPSLRYLNLSQNKLEKFPEQEESSQSDGKSFKYNLPVLEELCCQNNRLESIPEQIFRLPALSILDVSNNKLQSLPSNMWTAPSLKELNASFNLLKDLPTSFENVGFDRGDMEYPVISDGVEGSHHHSKSSPVHFRNYQVKDLRHQNLWSSSIEIAEQIVTDQCQQNCSHLSALNLAHNLFTSVPPLLACLAVNLTRLNMSYNSLRSMSHVTTYPSSLKQLDLSYNTITCWPSLPQVDTVDALIMCYSPEGSKAPKLLSRQSGGGLRNIVLHSLCPHRRHLKLDNLRTLIIADNCLERIQLTTDEEITEEDSNWDGTNARSRLLFPNLSMLDISNNKLKDIPQSIHDLTNLSVLNISGNSDISELPAQMGLLSRLWNLNTAGCNLQEPLKTMIESKKYKTMDVIGYLKSVLEDARPYARMKLMIVGVQGIGKTSLLEQLRQEGLSVRRKHEHWVKRMGNKNINVKTPKGTNMSTVGVDIGVWVYDKKTRGQGSKGPVMFRTWDFGGQKEYYATHQYFLSKRSFLPGCVENIRRASWTQRNQTVAGEHSGSRSKFPGFDCRHSLRRNGR
ncbi:UNVERIFIED_CONTAM: hypothetical protein PYX00_009712 [Menopon gallinae]|uniref:Roc domain-containing protein n=1 Tax=Menopon gallinae TaxID=328185 RepID=A0AAW2HC51_9NEOP